MRLRDAIAHVRRDGRQRMATCPAHDDQKPSVSVKSGADGRILLFDHGGCDTVALLAAAGLDWTDVAGGNDRAAPGRPAAEVSWAVRDRNGRLVAVHHRRDLSDGAKRMWWTRGGKTGLGGLRVADLPFYAVDRLGDLEPGDKPTFLLEGEPATDALLGLGLSAKAWHARLFTSSRTVGVCRSPRPASSARRPSITTCGRRGRSTESARPETPKPKRRGRGRARYAGSMPAKKLPPTSSSPSGGSGARSRRAATSD